MKCLVLPLKDYLVFPDCYTPVYIGRDSSLKATQMASKGDRHIVTCTQRDINNLNPRTLSDLYSRGTLCSIQRFTEYHGDQAKAILLGKQLFNIENVWFEDGVLWTEGAVVDDVATDQTITVDEAVASQTMLRQWYGSNEMEDFYENLKCELRLTVHANKVCGVLAHWKQRDKYVRTNSNNFVKSEAQKHEILEKLQALLENENARERFKLAQELVLQEIAL